MSKCHIVEKHMSRLNFISLSYDMISCLSVYNYACFTALHCLSFSVSFFLENTNKGV